MALTDVEEFDQGWTVGDTIYFLNGDRFDGPWDAGRQVMHGQGVYYWRDGQKFEGSFMNGIKVRFICLFSGIRTFCLMSLNSSSSIWTCQILNICCFSGKRS